MAKKQTQTGALDAGAMYQAGAAGTGGTKKATSSESSIISQIGRYALGYYMKAQDNLIASRKETSQIFAQLEGVAHDADFAMADITTMKKGLTKANKVLNSVRGMLLPNHDKVTAAQEDRDKILKDITKLSAEYTNFKDKAAYQHKVNDGLYQVKLDSGEQATAGWGDGNTAMQMYHTSLLINGELEESLSVIDGEIYVSFDYTDEHAPYWKDGDRTWDNPETTKVEKKPSGAMKLSDMEFATHANPNQLQHANNHIMEAIQFGKAGYDTEEFESSLIGDLSDLFGKMNNKEKVDYLFSNTGWMDEDNNSMSLIDGQIKEATKTSGLFTEEEFNKLDKNNDGVIGTYEDDVSGEIVNEIAGAKEILKLNILDGSYSTKSVEKMIHERAMEKYKVSHTKYEEDNKVSGTKKDGRTNWKVFQGAAADYNAYDKTKVFEFTFGGYDWKEIGPDKGKFEYTLANGSQSKEYTWKAIHQTFNKEYGTDRNFKGTGL